MLLIKNIRSLAGILNAGGLKLSGSEMKNFKSIDNAFLLIENGKIKLFGTMDDWQKVKDTVTIVNNQIDATGKFVIPAYCDSHTHIVYAAPREEEFVDRINGLSYEQIAQRGGGILNSAKKVALASEEELYNSALARIQLMINKGTCAIEIKSGYGLSVEGELKMLRVIKKLKENAGIIIKSTFLGAHAFPAVYKENRKGYIDLLINELMPTIEKENLADYCDVFCEQGYFSPEETIQILDAGQKHGMTPKVHANQMSNSGGVQAGVKCNAISVDHLEFVGEKEINVLMQSQTMPTVLPGAAFFLSLPLPPARKMIDAGLPLAVATDFNPGSSPTGDMNFMVSLLCIHYKLNPSEAFNAATINSAYAMNISDVTGSITIGKQANFIITKEISSLSYLPYSFNEHVIQDVFIDGKKRN